MHVKSQKNSKDAYTLILIPGKYGKSKTMNISPKLIFLLVSFFSLFIALSIILGYKYSELSKNQYSYKKNIQNQQNTINNQMSELDKLKGQETDIRMRIEEIKKLEEMLKQKLNTTVSQSSYITSDSSLIEAADNEISNVHSLLSKADIVKTSNLKKPHLFPCVGTITSYFGIRTSPTSRGTSENHTGLDIAGVYGTPIHSSADGIVDYSGWLQGYGKTIIINHLNGYSTLYGHNSKLLVQKGTKVKSGQTISLMGSTGRSTGTHVHFEIRYDGSVINPLKFIRGGK